jgi:hypothetical protein
MHVQKVNNGAVHTLVANTAKELAAADYERFARSNEFYRKYGSQNAWVAKAWRYYTKAARATLTILMTRSKDQGLKDSIYDALILDNSLNKGNLNKVQVIND